jgi:hypothetical protein
MVCAPSCKGIDVNLFNQTGNGNIPKAYHASKCIFHSGGTFVNIIHMAPHAFPGFENLLTEFTGQARVLDVESLHMSRHVALQLKLLEAVEAAPHGPPHVVMHPHHVGGDQPV